ncbi:MAG TPA: sugar ABC transporter permease [Candidatus Limiplasma sp.]|jgi:multiple sugar transport system permease protein|nr:sugar ABC transporter permease [Candidatus Limiplasma sp.]HPR77669.1 sugar ABC transporter permease [Candidatus Limiplasma sp.]
MKKSSISGFERRNTKNFYAFISPWLIGFLVLTVYPMFESFRLSLTDTGFTGTGGYIGFANFLTAFTADTRYWISFRNTLVYVLMFVPLNLILSFFLGWLLSRKVRCLGFFRSVFYIPYLTAGVAVTIMWGWLFNGSYGLINYVLSMFGISGPNWLGDKNTALMCIVLMNLWSIGNNILIMLSGIQDIPQSYYESAEIDGASTFRQIFTITIPLSTPTIFFNLVIGIINAFQLFNQPYILTDGGPVDSTRTMSMLVFQNAFEYGKMGYASAVAWTLFVAIMAITLIVQSTSRKWVFYGD